VLIDSNIIIYSANPKQISLRDLLLKEVSVSLITKVEVLGYHSLSTNAKVYLEAFFDSTPTLIISETIADRAIKLRQQKSLSLGDAIIAATALVHNLTLVTRNDTDFRHIINLKLLNPFSE